MRDIVLVTDGVKEIVGDTDVVPVAVLEVEDEGENVLVWDSL